MNDFSADVRLAQQGSSEAFSRLYATVYKDMYHIALYSLRNSHDASDAVSDTVLDAFCTIKKLKNPESFRGWIMKILSAKIKRMQRNYFEVPGELKEDTSISEFDFESVELRESIDKLDTGSRLLLSMSVLGGYSSEEISKICDIKASTVRARLSGIKKALRLQLTPDVS
ncbi:MAG: sigma-70 family RNA polymerase sigma factor [Ruminococcus sp.]|nr:sigma-70 family RNA polymerase sigma factor [Ruminococcus sp.]MBR6623228.1 sigma-70 family RNA polymerase sigma factor [Ruminococcus sp.]